MADLTKLQSIADGFGAALNRARADKLLSDEGRALAIGRAWLDARARFDAEVTRLRERGTADLLAAQEQMFGSGSLAGDRATLAVSMRDALDRAEKLRSPADALGVLERALSTGDETLARAVVRVAWERTDTATPAWGEVVDKYLAARPDRVATAERLVAAQDAALNDRQLMTLRMALARPRELAGIGDVAAFVDKVEGRHSGSAAASARPAGWNPLR